MCLYKGSNKMQTASKDIVCYKIVEIVDGKIRSYYQQTPIELNVPIKASNAEDKYNMDMRATLTDEVVHSYVSSHLSIEDIWNYETMSRAYHAIRIERGYKVSIAVLKCIIPKGTLYCSNILRTGLSVPEYGSVTLIPKKIIAKYEL